MVDTRLSRLTTPARARNGPPQAVPRLRASSVPAEGSRRLDWPLDCASTSPRKRKRTSVHEDSLSKSISQFQGTHPRTGRTPQREMRKAPAHAGQPRARGRGMSLADREIVAAGLVASSKANLRTRSATRSSSVDGRPRRRCASTSREQGDLSLERLPRAPAQRQQVSSRSRRNGRGTGSTKSASRAASIPLAVACAPPKARPGGLSRGRAKEKDKTRAAALEDHDVSMFVSVDESWDADESSVGERRSAKRRRLSPRLPQSLDLLDDEDDSQQTAVEEDFEMLDGPQSLPWVPVNPDSQHSEYVPPGLNALIDDMKRALVLQISARQKAENMHAEELQRRLDLEQEAARLAAANRALEAERSAWTKTARVPDLRVRATMLASDPSPQLALNSNALGTSGFAGPSGHTADVEMEEATRTVSANRAVGASAEHGDGSPSGMHARATTAAAPAV